MSFNSGRRGVALLYAVFGAFVAGSMVAVMLTAASVTRTKAELKADKLQARYLAEGGIEAAKKVIQTSVANFKTPPETGSTTIDGQTVDYTIATAGDQVIITDAAGMQTVVQPYEIESRVGIGDALVTAHRLIRTEATPIFQYAVFYTNDLEIEPGPSMTLKGRVHTNQDMFLGCGDTLTLNTNYVHAVGEMFRRRKDTTDSPGKVDIRKWVANPFAGSEPSQYVRMNSEAQMTAAGVDTDSGYDSSFTQGFDYDGDGSFEGDRDWLPFGPGALDMWGPPDGYASGDGNTVMTGEHGLSEVVAPDNSSIAMFDAVEGGDYVFNSTTRKYDYVGAGNGTHAKGYYHANAGLSIIVNSAGTNYEAYDGNGTDVKAKVAPAVSLINVYDSRQGGNVKVAKINMGILATTGAYPSNGLLYCSHYGVSTGTKSKGVELINGGELFTTSGSGAHVPAPLTVVTEGSAYIKGDYNTTKKVGAAIIGDAVNLLSNSWNGTKTGSSLPVASDTTFNVAMITGNHETVGSTYNGGLENLPRFHENWTNKKATITGSFVNTWFSQYATGHWTYGGNYYTAPLRIWSYDTAFNRVASLPPFTPMVVSAEDVVSW
jgi:hypothetical protein